MILGTAGHIDHGKTALVRALTGVDTDRLPEEKRRGITIELGFAPLALEGVGVLGVVDVPGHEAFVRTMLAGATGVDLALLVIAADEGVMPQTREHLAILDLLGVRAGVVALTKCDLVEDPDWLALVREDVRALLGGTALADAPIVETSASRGTGLDELRAAIVDAARAVPERVGDDLFRMPVDRAFTVRGTGTVVTGTVWSGALARDAAVQLWPAGRSARARTLQSHGAMVERVATGARAAVALVGVEVAEVARGSMLVEGAHWRPSIVLRADVTLLADAAREIGPRTALRLHLGTAEVGARVVARGGLTAGEPIAARVVLDAPIVARAGDRFVLRLPSPATTVGGGVILDPTPPRRARPWPVGADVDLRLRLLLEEGGATGLEAASLPVRLGLTPAATDEQVARLGAGVRRFGSRLVSREELSRLAAAVEDRIRDYHAAEPLEPGMPLQLLRSRLHAPAEVVDAVLAELSEGGRVVASGARVRAADWAPTLGGDERRLTEALVEELRVAAAEPPSVGELAERHGAAVPRLLRYLERQGLVTAVEADRYYERDALDRVVARLAQGMGDGREYSPTELRELLGVSRKYLIPLLEHCDRVGYTTRHGGGRVWRAPRLQEKSG